MKIMKKIAGIILAVCLICPCLGNVALAADGRAYFTDLETSVGEIFTVTGTVVAKNDVVGKATIELTYDTNYIRFMEGDAGVEVNSGKIVFNGSGDGRSDSLTFKMTFQALQEGSTRMEQTGANVKTNSGETVNCSMGYSAIEIGEGDPSKIQTETTTTGTIVVNNKECTISDVFSSMEIPTGFTEGELNYNGVSCKCVVQETSGIKAAYLVDAEGAGSFFIYDEKNNEFYPFEEIMISDTYSIIILDGTGEITLPEKYQGASIEINGVDFPVWIEPERDGFYIFYAVNSDGEKSLYLYDSTERTYQRMETPRMAEEGNKEVSDMDKIMGFIEDNIIWVVVGAACALIVLLILTIVLAVKLRHRNLELDDLYDEYGIDLDDDTEKKSKSKKQMKSAKEEKDYYLSDDFEDEYDEYEDEYDDDYDDEYDEYDDEYDEYEDEYDDEYDDEYEEDDLAELRKDYSGADTGKKDYDSYYDDGDFDDDYCDEENNAKLRKDDTYEMNFIDLE